MNTNEQKISANEQLLVIREMIEKTKKNTVDNGWPLIMWGWFILASCIFHYIIIFFGSPPLSWLPWAIFMPAGGIVHFIIEFKTHKTQKILTYAEKSIGWIWIGCGSAMFIIGFIAPASGIIGWQAITPLMALLAGIGTLVTSKIIEWKFLFYCSMLWWVAGIATMFINPFYHNMIFGGVVIIAYLIPGYTLRKEYKKV